MRVEPSQGRRLGLSLEDYFTGRTRGWGVIEDRFGRLRRQFIIEVLGETLPDGLRLDERIRFDNGEESSRTWLMTALGEGRYEARTQDLVGRAFGRLVGSSFHWSYRLRLPFGGRPMVISFDDKLYLQPDGVLINRARLSKLGFGLAHMTVSFRRTDDNEAGFELAAE